MSTQKLQIKDRTIFDGFLVKVLLKYLYIAWFKLSGWKAIGNPPHQAGITIAAPHTSNWDIVYALGAAIMFDIKIYFSIKESWCRLPVVGKIMLWMGGMPIDRSSGAKGQVELIKNFVRSHKHERIFFLFTPEGTRGSVSKWKTGFYHVAQDAGLPIFLAKVDYRNKESGVFHAMDLTGDKNADIANIQESYKRVCGRFPEQQFPPYSGPLPDISPVEARVLRALDSLKEKATQTEISARARFEELSQEMLDFLVEKGIVSVSESIVEGKTVNKYQLTLAGKGVLFHLPLSPAAA